MEDFPDLYSTNAQLRLEASKNYFKQFPENRVPWPFGNWGAANAYVVLLGPSPGRGSHDKTTKSFGRIGTHTPIQFNDHKNRNINWRELNMACFGFYANEEVYSHLSAIHNLDSDNCSNETDIQASLKDGCAAEWKRLNEVKPVIVAVLSRKTFEAIYGYIEENGMHPETVSPQQYEGYGKAVLAFTVRLKDAKFPTLFVKTPQHPSRPLPKIKTRLPGTSDVDIRTKPIIAAVNWFLKKS